MRFSSSYAAAFVVTMAVSSLFFEHDAHACGACFHPPPPPPQLHETPSVVTDHRMVLSVSKKQSTLWDQVKYSGSPASFAWVLPISGSVEIGLSADVIFEALDQATATSITEPLRNCPEPRKQSSSGGGGGCSSSTTLSASFSGSAAPQEAGTVVVTNRQVVGPYETVQLKATDANALEKWLAQNGFVVPSDVQPVVDAYVKEKFDFLALKLLPNKGVQDMRPVRVTTQGANTVLPLRMVAIGTGAVVGITLWVIGEGRYEPQNFPTFHIQDDELVWDWAQSKSNYTELRAQKTLASNGRAWDLESSTVSGADVSTRILSGLYNGAYLEVDDDAGAPTKSAQAVGEEDVAQLFSGINPSTARVTRLRGDLSRAALATDLVMIASQDQGVLPRIRNVVKEMGEPLCPASNASSSGYTMVPRDQAQQYADGGDERFSCSTGAATESSVWLGAGVASVAFMFLRARRRRRDGSTPKRDQG